jgi:hypothetical protein
MSKPVLGDPQVDVEWSKFLLEAKGWSAKLKNISLKDCRKGTKILQQLSTATNDAAIERLQQSQGGQKGDRIKKESKI